MMLRRRQSMVTVCEWRHACYNKHGKENTKATVNVSVEASYFQPMNTPEFADGPTFMRTYNEAQQARSATVITPRYSDEIIAATESGINPYVYPNVDWYDMIFL